MHSAAGIESSLEDPNPFLDFDYPDFSGFLSPLAPRHYTTPIFKILFWWIVRVFIILTWIGGSPVERPFYEIGQITRALYFIYFIFLGTLYFILPLGSTFDLSITFLDSYPHFLSPPYFLKVGKLAGVHFDDMYSITGRDNFLF